MQQYMSVFLRSKQLCGRMESAWPMRFWEEGCRVPQRGWILSLPVKASLTHCGWPLPGWRFSYLLSLAGEKSVRKEECSVCAPQGVNICDVCACPRSVSAASFLIKKCSNQPRGLLCEVEEPKLFVNSVQIQWIFFTHPRNVSFLHFATKCFHFVTNLISFLECEMIILFCCKDYSWVDPSHKYCCEVFLKFGCQLEKINCLHSWLHETDQQLWCHIWDQGLCQETESTNKTGQPPCIYFAMGKMMYPICSSQSFVFAGHGVRNRTYKATICCFV